MKKKNVKLDFELRFLITLPLLMLAVSFYLNFFKEVTPIPEGYKLNEDWLPIKVHDMAVFGIKMDKEIVIVFDDDSVALISEDIVGLSPGVTMYTKNLKTITGYKTLLCSVKDLSFCAVIDAFENPKYDAVTKGHGFIKGFNKTSNFD